jgi:DNA-binding CsgD family transcriptional regulator
MMLGSYLRARPLSDAEVIYLLDAARGLSAAQSARLRQRSVNTVTSALQGARFALGADTTLHAVTLALAYGEISVEDIYPKLVNCRKGERP